MTDERAALIERLSLMAMAEADTVAEMIEDNEDVEVIVEGRRDAQFFASCAAELARLSEVARALREALEPFAKEALLWPDYVPDSDGVFIASPDDVIPILDEFASLSGRRTAGIQYSDNTVTVGDLRKARAALARAKGEAE